MFLLVILHVTTMTTHPTFLQHEAEASYTMNAKIIAQQLGKDTKKHAVEDLQSGKTKRHKGTLLDKTF